jgi:V8-like Glu-specific endopeptidase
LTVAAGLLAAPAGATAASPSDAVWQSPDAIREYWTHERMRSAPPIEALAGGRSARHPALHSGFERRQITDTERYPNSTHGKVFGTIPDVGDFQCSGTVVHSASHSLILTAGHCVYDHDTCGGCFAVNLQFVPGYREGQHPFGSWAATQLSTTPGWMNGADSSFDVGAAVLETKDGRGVEDAAGALGAAFDKPRQQTYAIHGYPGAGQFDGQKHWVCTSGYGGADGGTPPAPMRAACDMSEGSSGGSWVIADRYVASVVSYGYLLLGINDLYGPYFGSEIRALYHAAGGEADPGPVEITRQPRAITRDRSPTFRFRADVLGGMGVFRCRLDRGRWQQCDSPITYRRLGAGKHVFRVEAGDWEGGWSGTPTSISFTIDNRN